MISPIISGLNSNLVLFNHHTFIFENINSCVYGGLSLTRFATKESSQLTNSCEYPIDKSNQSGIPTHVLTNWKFDIKKVLSLTKKLVSLNGHHAFSIFIYMPHTCQVCWE